MNCFGGIYGGRRVLLTGHTGFKGSWLALWLKTLGAEVTGLALPPDTKPNHWDGLGLAIPEFELDIGDADALSAAVQETNPEIVFHLAAQSLVRRSYREPLETLTTNVMGTAYLLESCRRVESLRAILVVTTDKCYENRESIWGYRESDPLGGHDPYSASKAACELVSASYRSSFFSGSDAPLMATARAGNVVGGGDWSVDRLIPDMVRAVRDGKELEIRSPQATRPWQHVLDSLSGYLLLGQKLLEGHAQFADAWNFGPDHRSNRTVLEILQRLQAYWPALQWHGTEKPQPHEATFLHLDSTKARRQLSWQPAWDLEQALQATADWYLRFLDSGEVSSRDQLADYMQGLDLAQ